MVVASGFTLAVVVAVLAVEDSPVYGLIAIVPLLDTCPNLADKPWGDNEYTVGLTPAQLLADLAIAFSGMGPAVRKMWHFNPSEISDEDLTRLPKVVMVISELDILFKSQLKFVQRLIAQGVDVNYLRVAGLHQVKDMDCTEACRAVREYVRQHAIGFMERACSTSY